MSVKTKEYAYAHGLTEDAVIKKIRDGELDGFSSQKWRAADRGHRAD
jgi:hypothetical protein